MKRLKHFGIKENFGELVEHRLATPGFVASPLAATLERQPSIANGALDGQSAAARQLFRTKRSPAGLGSRRFPRGDQRGHSHLVSLPERTADFAAIPAHGGQFPVMNFAAIRPFKSSLNRTKSVTMIVPLTSNATLTLSYRLDPASRHAEVAFSGTTVPSVTGYVDWQRKLDHRIENAEFQEFAWLSSPRDVRTR